jgi:DNA polymerase (family 10)
MYSLAKETGHDLSSAAKTLNNEAEIYKSIGIPYIIPELRENRGEISAAIDSRLPDVVELDDIKGDVHVHSNWSDGAHSIESIAKYAMSLGYEYIAITDHSKSLKIAQGLDEQRLLLQIELIKKTNSNLENFRILTGIEVDILSDELDFNDDVLSKLDIVIASIHTGFRQERAKITNRILSACENPHVDIIAHPTGRILGRRDPYDVDIDAIIDKAAETGTALEINSSPDRLDLNDIMAKKAKDKGVKITIGTDAHEKEGLKDINFGVWVARRGWLEKGDVLNTMPFDEMYEWLKTN